MARRRRAVWPPLERDLCLTQRTLGEVRAAQEGRLTRRLVKRAYHRGAIRLLRKARLW